MAPVLVGGGAAVHDGAIRPAAFALALLGVVLLLVGVNLGNDYFDFRSGADPPLGVGTRPLQAGLLAPGWFLASSLGALLAGGAIGIGLAVASRPEVLLLGTAGSLLGFFYTAPPLRLGYRGLGEPIVFALLGPGATLGAYVVTANRLSLGPALAGVPIGLVAAALLHANNLRDLADDARAGKRTLAVRLGSTWAIREFRVLLWGAELVVVGLAVLVTPFLALGLLTLPEVRDLTRTVEPGLAPGRELMRRAARLHRHLAVLLAVALALSGRFH